jgi:hypothetical protein
MLHSAEWLCVLSVVMLIMLSVACIFNVMLNVAMPSVIMVSVVALCRKNSLKKSILSKQIVHSNHIYIDLNYIDTLKLYNSYIQFLRLKKIRDFQFKKSFIFLKMT